MIGYILMGLGVVLTAFGIAGTWFLPDLLLRMHASTKCGVTGAATILMGLMFHGTDYRMVIKIGIIMAFIFATAPLVAHILAVGYYNEQEDRE